MTNLNAQTRITNKVASDDIFSFMIEYRKTRITAVPKKNIATFPSSSIKLFERKLLARIKMTNTAKINPTDAFILLAETDNPKTSFALPIANNCTRRERNIMLKPITMRFRSNSVHFERARPITLSINCRYMPICFLSVGNEAQLSSVHDNESFTTSNQFFSASE
uniref:Uncharacterized protein n=1 Tax=Opuntia streptacantha TaxID=393608 RepID=A0A7C9AQA0_OPUST